MDILNLIENVAKETDTIILCKGENLEYFELGECDKEGEFIFVITLKYDCIDPNISINLEKKGVPEYFLNYFNGHIFNDSLSHPYLEENMIRAINFLQRKKHTRKTMTNISEIKDYLKRFNEVHTSLAAAYMIGGDTLYIQHKVCCIVEKITQYFLDEDTLNIENVEKILKDYCDYIFKDEIVGFSYLIGKTIEKLERHECSIEFILSDGDTLSIESFDDDNYELNILEVNGDIENIIGKPIDNAINHKKDDTIDLFKDFTIATKRGSVNIKLDATTYDGSYEYPTRLCLRKIVKRPDWYF